jgi:hypothetical protein
MPDLFVLCNGDSALSVRGPGRGIVMMYSNSSVYLALSNIACIAGRWGGALSRLCRKGLIPNSAEYGAGAGRVRC